MTPRTPSGTAAAYISAIVPPSLWPNSTGRVMPVEASSSGSTTVASASRKSAGQGRDLASEPPYPHRLYVRNPQPHSVESRLGKSFH